MFDPGLFFGTVFFALWTLLINLLHMDTDCFPESSALQELLLNEPLLTSQMQEFNGAVV